MTFRVGSLSGNSLAVMWDHLTLYPDLPAQRRAQILRDVLALLLVVLFVWCGIKVHDLVAALAVLGEGVREAGHDRREADSPGVADAVGGIPLVGEALAGAFTCVGDGTGGNVADLGQSGVDAVYLLARTLGILTAALPIRVLLVAVVPRRVRTIREMSAAREVVELRRDRPGAPATARHASSVRSAVPRADALHPRPVRRPRRGPLRRTGRGRARRCRADPPSRDGTCRMSAPDLVVATTVDRAPDAVWAVVADPVRLAEFSPEAHHVSGASPGPLPAGSTFGGANRRGAFRWSTRCDVVESTPGEAFAFAVTYLGMAVALWRYELTAHAGGTRVEEQWTDRRGIVMKAIGAVGTGVADRRTHNERTMRATLDALKHALEVA